MRYKHYSIPATALAIVFFFNISSVLAGGPGGGVLGVDTVLKIVRIITTSPVNTVRFAPDDSYIISSDGTSDMKIFDVNSGEVIDTINSGTENNFSGFIFSRSGKYLVAKTGPQINVYDPKSFQLLKTLKDTASNYNARMIDISMDDRYIAMVSDKNFYSVWEWQSGKPVKREEFSLVTPKRTYNGLSLDFVKFSLVGNYLGVLGAYTYSYQNKPYSDPISVVLKTVTWDSTDASFRIGYDSKSGKLNCFYSVGAQMLTIRDNSTDKIVRQISISSGTSFNYTITSDDKYAIFNDTYGGLTSIFRIETGELLAKYPGYSLDNLSTSLSNKYILASALHRICLISPPWESISVPTKPEQITTLYPNPTNGDITVELVLNIPTQLSASFIDTKGTIVKKQNLGIRETGKISISTSEVPSGAYTLLISGSGYNKAFRMVVAR